MDVSQDTTKGISEPLSYGHNTGADTLTPDSSITRQVVL